MLTKQKIAISCRRCHDRSEESSIRQVRGVDEGRDSQVNGFEPQKILTALVEAGFPAKGDTANMNTLAVVLLSMLLTLYSSMIYAPLAAFLAEQFPTRIRYSSVAVAYNFGSGWFGGSLPFVVAALSLHSGDNLFLALVSRRCCRNNFCHWCFRYQGD